VIKSRNIGWAGHVARMKRQEKIFCLENLNRRDHSEDVGVDGRI